MFQFRLLFAFTFSLYSFFAFSQELDTTTYKLELNGLLFLRSVHMYYLPQTCEVKPPGYVAPTAYATEYKIWRLSDGKQLFRGSGETYFEFKDGMAHPPIVIDVDFDKQPDLWIPQPNFSSGYRYFGYKKQSDQYELLFLSNLHDLKIDTLNKRATGYELRYNMNLGKPETRVDYVLEGKGLTVLTKKETVLFYPISQQKQATREFRDYNFDGKEDFRVKCDSCFGNGEGWSYYLFNATTNAYQYDTLLSSLKQVYWDEKTHMCGGLLYLTSRSDLGITEKVSYQFIQGELKIIQKQVCILEGTNENCTTYLYGNYSWKEKE